MALLGVSESWWKCTARRLWVVYLLEAGIVPHEKWTYLGVKRGHIFKPRMTPCWPRGSGPMAAQYSGHASRKSAPRPTFLVMRSRLGFILLRSSLEAEIPYDVGARQAVELVELCGE